MARTVDCRIWLKEGETVVLDDDRARLLALVDGKGSIAAAAEEAGLTARRAGGVVRLIEEAAGFTVVARAGRGKATLTAEGKALLQEFNAKKKRTEEQLVRLYENPALTTDGIVLVDGELVLIRRGRDPGKGKYALPGGFVEYGERAEDCVVREVLEETGLETEVLDLVGVYSDPGRDPRGHLVSVVFFLRPVGGELKAGDDAAGAGLFDVDDLPELAFDHRTIIADFLAAHPRSRR